MQKPDGVRIHFFFSVCFQKIIEEVEEMLNNLPGVTSVHGRFYDLSSKYYRIIGNHAAYYKDALRYLGCVDIKDLPGGLNTWWETDFFFFFSLVEHRADCCHLYCTETEKQERAFTVGLAGLLGEGVYNFGELVGFGCVYRCVLIRHISHASWCVYCCASTADASCAGVPEEHRQTVAHRYSLCLQWRKRGEIPELQVCLGPTGESQCFCDINMKH